MQGSCLFRFVLRGGGWGEVLTSILCRGVKGVKGERKKENRGPLPHETGRGGKGQGPFLSLIEKKKEKKMRKWGGGPCPPFPSEGKEKRWDAFLCGKRERRDHCSL